MRIAIIGASGEIGARITQSLFVAGKEPRAISRKLGNRLARWSGLDFVSADLSDAAKLRDALSGIEVVMDCSIDKTPSVSDDVRIARNVNGCRNLIKVAQDVGVARLIHFSSIVVVPPMLTDEVLDRPYVYSKNDDWYTRAKIRCEKMVLGSASPKMVVVRPGVVYGPFMNWSALAFSRLAGGVVNLPPQRGVKCPAIHVDDLVSLVLCVAEAPQVPAMVWAVNPEQVSWKDFFDAHGASSGLEKWRVLEVSTESIQDHMTGGPLVRQILRWCYNSPLISDRMRRSKLMRKLARAYASHSTPPASARSVPGVWPIATEADLYASTANFDRVTPSDIGRFRYSVSLAEGSASAGDWWKFKCSCESGQLWP